MELPTYTYDLMTSEERDIVSKDFTHPVVIRGFYKPKAIKVGFEGVTKMFGDADIPVELYNTADTSTSFGPDGFDDMSIPDLLKYWKKDRLPSIYCAEVDLYDLEDNVLWDNNCLLDRTLQNPNLESRKALSLLLYLGNNHASGLHLHVSHDYILNQLYGSKTVYIFDNYENPNIRKNRFFQVNKSNFADENFFKMDHSKMKVYKVILQPGDSLLIPPWYWHATQGHGINTSITQTFTRKDRSYLLKNPNLIFDYFIDDYRDTLPYLFIVIVIVLYVYVKRRALR